MNGDPIQGIELNYGGIYNNVLFSSYISEMYKSPQTQKDGSYDIKFEDSPMGIVRIIAKDMSRSKDLREVNLGSMGKRRLTSPTSNLKRKKNKIWTNAQTSKNVSP